MSQYRAHRLVYATACELATLVYEELLKDNKTYRRWKEQFPDKTPKQRRKQYVDLVAPAFLDQARATLAALLLTPIDDLLKNEIQDALILDRKVRAPR